jgi:hypothetical protein
VDDRLKELVQPLGIGSLSQIPRRFEYQAFSLSCSGTQALSHWQSLRSLTEQSGYWPVILGSDKEASRVLAIEEEPPRRIIDLAVQFTADDWLASRKRELHEMSDDFEQSLHGEWPENPRPMPNFTIPFERVGSGPPKEKVTIALFPTKYGWEVPAYLNIGGWNECPDPTTHVVMMKHWFDAYGAEFVGTTGDVVEMVANKPPQSREEALRLAEHQFLYCEDIVIQGTQTIEALAAALLGHHIWYFWWD